MACRDEGAEIGFHGILRGLSGPRIVRDARLRRAAAVAAARLDPAPRRQRHRRAVADHEMVEQAQVDQRQRLLQPRGHGTVGGDWAPGFRWGGCGRRSPRRRCGRARGAPLRAGAPRRRRACPGTVPRTPARDGGCPGTAPRTPPAAGRADAGRSSGPAACGSLSAAPRSSSALSRRWPSSSAAASVQARAGPRPGSFASCAGRALEQGAQRAVLGQQFARGGDRIAPAQARAEEDRQQFGIRQRPGTAGEQFFAGAFVGGPVADVHGYARSRREEQLRLRTWLRRAATRSEVELSPARMALQRAAPCRHAVGRSAHSGKLSARFAVGISQGDGRSHAAHLRGKNASCSAYAAASPRTRRPNWCVACATPARRCRWR